MTTIGLVILDKILKGRSLSQCKFVIEFLQISFTWSGNTLRHKYQILELCVEISNTLNILLCLYKLQT